ncbi:MAG: phosphoribosylglycinamide formyltransferase [Thermoleophilia bacterium]|nr:phosphoribosylglycinamide formyltransferase [Thermoleophilia bacterium]
MSGLEYRLGVLVSGSGSNLQSIIDKLHQGPEDIKIAVVISDNNKAPGLTRAAEAGIPTAVFPMIDYDDRLEHDRAMAEELERHEVDLVVLAGYMMLVTPALLDRFPYLVINLHPSLLPAFPGGSPIEDTMDYGARITGVTVHYVDEGTDSGPIILQEAVEIKYNDTVESLRARIHEVEHRLLPHAIELIANNQVRFDEDNPRRVLIREEI